MIQIAKRNININGDKDRHRPVEVNLTLKGRHMLYVNKVKYLGVVFDNMLHVEYIYEGRLQSSWTELITLSLNFVEVRCRSLFRSTFLGKRCTSYNAPTTSRKRAAYRWSLRDFLPRSSLFMVGKAQKSHAPRSGLYGGCSNGVPQISVSASIALFNRATPTLH
jgi:hypothetical protein